MRNNPTLGFGGQTWQVLVVPTVVRKTVTGAQPAALEQTSVVRGENIPPPPETEPATNSGARLEDVSENETNVMASALLVDNSTPEREDELTNTLVRDGSPPKDV